MRNIDEYSKFMPVSHPKETFEFLLEEFLFEKYYNTDVGDMIPLIAARALQVKIVIIEQVNFEVTLREIEARSSSETLYVFKLGEHYDALVLAE